MNARPVHAPTSQGISASRLNVRFGRIAAITIALMVAAAPVVLWGCWVGLSEARNAPIYWLSPDFPQRRDLDAFVEEFASEEVIVVSWDGCTVDDERLRRLGEEIRSPRWRELRERSSHLTGQVLTGYEALRRLTAEPLSLSRREAARRLQGVLVGPDGQTSCAVLVTRRADPARRRGTIDFILYIAERQVGVPAEEIRLAGAHVEGVAVDIASRRSFVRYLPLAALVCLLLCRLSLRSWWLTLTLLGLAAFAGAFVLALCYFTGATLNAVLLVMAPLVLLLTVSSGIHLVNYYYEQVNREGIEHAPRAMLRVGWWPCTLAVMTTVIGLLSLVVADMLPVQQFGIYASAGLLLALALLLLVIPGILVRFGRSGSTMQPEPQQPTGTAGSGRVQRYTSSIHRRAKWIVMGCVLLLVATAVGLTQLRTSVSIYNLLPEDHPLIRDYVWFEEHLGPLVPLETVIRFDEGNPLDVFERAALVHRVQQSIAEMEMISGTMSAVTFVPEVPTGRGFSRTIRRSYVRSLLERDRERLIEAHWLAESDDGESWRVSARLPAFADLDYGQVLKQLDEQVMPLIPSGVSVTFTGITPVVHAAQEQLLRDLFGSFLTALALVSIVMMAVLRNVAAGLVAMIPNIYPAVTLFGLMGWLELSVDIGTVMTASAALGIAVDGTIHMLTWFHRGLSNGLARPQSVGFALAHCGRAIVQTTLVCGLGLMVFVMSEFTPTSRFAWMMFTLLAMALVADLLLLPALLVSPLGAIFHPQRRQKESAVTGAENNTPIDNERKPISAVDIDSSGTRRAD